MIYSDFKTKIQDGHAPCQFIDRRQHFCYVMICFQDSPIVGRFVPLAAILACA